MAIFSFLWRRVSALLSTVLLLVIVIALFVIYRVASYGQQDNTEHLAAKRDYLAQLEALAQLPADAPNLVFILYDDMGYGDIGAGSDSALIDTPHIDQLADHGIVLSDFYSPAPVCTPARAVDIIERFGSDRLMVNSAGDWGPSKPTAVPDLIMEMRRRGHDEGAIRKIVLENPHTFFSQSANFTFELPGATSRLFG